MLVAPKTAPPRAVAAALNVVFACTCEAHFLCASYGVQNRPEGRALCCTQRSSFENSVHVSRDVADVGYSGQRGDAFLTWFHHDLCRNQRVFVAIIHAEVHSRSACHQAANKGHINATHQAQGWVPEPQWLNCKLISALE